MELYILGNGFDLGHGMPTRYSDFKEYLEVEEDRFLEEFCRAYYMSDAKLWRDLESELANIDHEILYESMYQETDLGLESGNVDIADTLLIHFRSNFEYIEDLTKHLKSWIEELNDSISEYKIKTSFISSKNNDLFINFNYTTTLEDLYGISRDKVLHIHGCVKSDEDLVLGHSNLEKEAEFLDISVKKRNELDEQSYPIYSVLAEYCRKTYKNVNYYIDEINEFDLSEVNCINVIGHSLGNVDMPYFERVHLLTKPDTKWFVYYYDEKEMTHLNEQLNSIGVNDIEFKNVSEFYVMAVEK